MFDERCFIPSRSSGQPVGERGRCLQTRRRPRCYVTIIILSSQGEPYILDPNPFLRYALNSIESDHLPAGRDQLAPAFSTFLSTRRASRCARREGETSRRVFLATLLPWGSGDIIDHSVQSIITLFVGDEFCVLQRRQDVPNPALARPIRLGVIHVGT